MAKVITVATQKGGVGKTTMSVNVAAAFSKLGYKTLIIDADMQGHVILSFGQDPKQQQYTLWDVLVDGLPAEAAIVNVAENLDVLPCNKDLRFFEWRVWRKDNINNPFDLMKNSCDHLRNFYDFIIIDSPPNLGLMQGNALRFADDVLIPFHPEPYSISSLMDMHEAILEAKESTNPNLNILGVVGNMVQISTNIHTNNLTDLGKYCDHHQIYKFGTYIPRAIRYPNAVYEDGVPAVLTSKENTKQVKANYYDLVREIIEQYECKA